MSENFNKHHGHHEREASYESNERLPISAETQSGHEHADKTSQQHEADPLLHSINALQARAEHEAKSSEDYNDLDEDSKPSQSFMIHRNLKDESYRRTLQKARRQLNPVDKTFSRLIHQPIIEAASSATANTIGRASGLFAGSLFALLGSAFLLYMTKRYGFTYNYGVFVLCFIGGFALGLLIELMVRSVRRRRS